MSKPPKGLYEAYYRTFKIYEPRSSKKFIYFGAASSAKKMADMLYKGKVFKRIPTVREIKW